MVEEMDSEVVEKDWVEAVTDLVVVGKVVF
jgi:hypothetical protein